MAKIVSLQRTSKNIRITTNCVADFDMNDQYFSIWSYKDGDLKRSGACPQNMQFDKAVARQLRDALNEFLLEQ